MTPDEDRDAIERYRKGDSSAFDEIVKRHEPSVQRLVLRYVKIEEDAKDVSQRAFMRALAKLDTFRGDASFSTWLHRIAVNLALNHVRGEQPVDPLPADDIPAFTHALATSKLVAADVWRRVSARLDELSPMQRLAVELRVFHELSFKEIAAIAGCSEDSAKANYHHGVHSLRDIISR